MTVDRAGFAAPILPGLALSRAVVDRAADRRADEQWLADAWDAPGTGVVRLADGGAAAVVGDPPVLDLAVRPDVPAAHRFFLGLDDAGTAYFAVRAPG
ncbi:MAG: NAD(+) diphosphatase, partial [Actinomycetes bacterium]